MKAISSLILAAALLTLTSIANAEEPVKLSSAEMDSVTAGQNHTSFDDLAVLSNVIANANAKAISGPNASVYGDVTDRGTTRARADADNF